MKFLTWEPERGARMGHQTTGWFSAHIIAARHGCQVVHQSFAGNAHEWEPELALGVGDLRDAPLDCVRVPFTAEEEARLDAPVSRPTLYVLAKNSNANDTFSGRDLYRARYWAKARPRCFPQDGRKNVAIHLRRGDVGPQNEPGRWIPEEPYLRLLGRLLSAYPDARYYLYSEGERLMFCHFERRGCEIRTDATGFDGFHAFHALASADLIVGSKSAFPYYAGMLCNGTVIMPPFWHSYPSEGLWAPSVQLGTPKWYTMEV